MPVIFDYATGGGEMWTVRLFPQDAARLPGNPITLGMRSIVIADDVELDSERQTLTIERDRLRVITIGWGDRGLVILSPNAPTLMPFKPRRVARLARFKRQLDELARLLDGPEDMEFRGR
jgi:hypothetical protein